MTPWRGSLLAGLLLLSGAAVGDTLDGGRIGSTAIYDPPQASQGLVILLGDVNASPSAGKDAAIAIVEAGHTVAVVDTSRYLATLDALPEDCHRAAPDLFELARRVSRSRGLPVDTLPVLAGTGSGGALAYAALAQAAPNQFAGAIAVDFVPELPQRIPLCLGAPYQRTEGGYRYLPTPNLVGWWRVATKTPGDTAIAAYATGAQAKIIPLRSYDDTGSAVIGSLAGEAAQSSAGGLPLSDLPLVLLPAAGHQGMMAIIYSGDGGWRDLDKQTGGILQQSGIPVVGVDTLRYFWRKKTPEEVAQGLKLIIDHYTAVWDAPSVLLVGYSFGADVLPFAVNRLPATERSQVKLITLLGLSKTADFEIHVSGWLGASPAADALPLAPELQRLDPHLVQCFYGADEKDETGCTDEALANAQVFVTEGGHHFDGDYPALAQRIIDGAIERGAPLRSPADHKDNSQ